MPTDRLACIVPFCRCTIAASRIPWASEWICAKHWRKVPDLVKTRHTRAKRRVLGSRKKIGNAQAEFERRRQHQVITWEAVKRSMIEGFEG